MRITYIINQYPKVSHTFIRREILALERLGHQVQRLSIRGWDEKQIDPQDQAEQLLTQYILQAGALSLILAVIKVFLYKPIVFFETFFLAIQLSKKSEKSLIYHIIYFFEACQASIWLRNFNGAHIHAHFGTNPSTVALLTSALGEIPYSFTVHGPEEFDRPVFLKLADKINRAKFVVAISSFGKSQLQRWVAFSQWHKIKIVHCGLEPDFYTNQQNDMPVEPIMVCVGRLCEQKGQLLLIEAAKKLVDNGVNFQLILAGDGEMRDEIEHRIISLGLQKQIHITGWITSEAVRQQILAAQILVLPSFAEGLPVVIMEAMSLKRPVISTYIAGIPELVKHGENGWLCAAGDVEALSLTMQNALLSPMSVLKLMGESAFHQVIVRHDINHEAQMLAEHFQAKVC